VPCASPCHSKGSRAGGSRLPQVTRDAMRSGVTFSDGSGQGQWVRPARCARRALRGPAVFKSFTHVVTAVSASV
jgi:hypothetical protein